MSIYSLLNNSSAVNSPQACRNCDALATKAVTHNDGLSFIPSCDACVPSTVQYIQNNLPHGEADTVFDLPTLQANDNGGDADLSTMISNTKIFDPPANTILEPFELRAVQVQKDAMRPLWRSPGGKQKMANILLTMFPQGIEGTSPVTTYVESFIGAGAVLLRKEPHPKEIINDYDPTVAERWQFMKSVTDEEIAQLAQYDWTLSRPAYSAAYEMKPSNALEEFYRNLYLTLGTMFGLMPRNNGGGRYRKEAEGRTFNVIERLPEIRDRLQNVTVLNQDYATVAIQNDSPEAFHFFDPPYPGYVQEIGEGGFDEVRFAKTLHELQGKFLVTYGTKGNRDLFSDFKVDEMKTPVTGWLAQRTGRDHTITVIISNYDIPVELQKAVISSGDLDGGGRLHPGRLGHSFFNSDVDERVLTRKKDGKVKSTVTWNGYTIAVEHVGGDMRHPEGPFPTAIPKGMQYGFFDGIKGEDGDSLDVIMGPAFADTDVDPVFLVAQCDPNTGAFAQYKVLLGFKSSAEARAAFGLFWPSKMFCGITEYSVADFRTGVMNKLHVQKAAIAAPSWTAHTRPKDIQPTKVPVPVGPWSTEVVNDLPDTAFLFVDEGGIRDADGKTQPRSLRHFPVRDMNGKLDLPHLRNALARIDQADIPEIAKEEARALAEKLLVRANDEQQVEKAERVEYRVPILKVDDEERTMLGVVLEPDEIDAHKDTITPSAIKRTAYNFLAGYGRDTRLGLMHKAFGDIGIELVECYVTTEDAKINGERVKAGSWLIRVRCLSDFVWQKVKRGELTGFSIGGYASVRPV